MADEQQRAVEVQHHVFEPRDGIDIQMIGRLVQQQEVGLRDQCASEHHPPPPAARQGTHRRIAIELQARDDLLHLQFGLPILVRRRPLHHRAGVGRAGQDAAHDHVAHRGIARRRHFLGQTRDSRAGAHPHLAAVRDDLTSNELQQRRLALAVAPEQADAFAPANLQIGIIQQRFEAETQGNFVEANGGHESHVKRLRINSPATETWVTDADAPCRLRNICVRAHSLEPQARLT